MKVTEARSNPEGWRYQHVQAIIVAIDQYADAATRNREFFLNKGIQCEVGFLSLQASLPLERLQPKQQSFVAEMSDELHSDGLVPNTRP